MENNGFNRSGEGGLDLIWEARGIAPLIGRSERQVAHMLASGSLPGAKKVGGRWCIDRRDLFAAFQIAPAAAVK